VSSAGWRQLPHTSDIYIEAYGRSLEEAFEQAGLALFRTIIPVAEGVERWVEAVAEAQDLQGLLYEWLETLLHFFYLDFLVRTFVKSRRISVGEEFSIEGVVGGVEYTRAIHETGTAVKSPTYAFMEIDTAKNVVRFVLDI
jgi:SHS2 domain-containing protein